MNPATLQAINRMYGAVDLNSLQVREWSYYDYIRLAPAGTNQLAFFAVGAGGTDPVSALAKTLEETNCPTARSFGGETAFLVQQIRTHIAPLPKGRQPTGISNQAGMIFAGLWNPAAIVLNDLSNLGVLNFRILQKDIVQIGQPFKACPPGGGVQINELANVSAGAPFNTLWYQQSTDDSDCWAFEDPVMISPTVTFSLTIDFPTTTTPVLTNIVNSATPAINIGVWLDGWVIRPQ